MSEARFRVDYFDSVNIDSYKDLEIDENGLPKNAKASVTIGSSISSDSSAEFEISASKSDRS